MTRARGLLIVVLLCVGCAAEPVPLWGIGTVAVRTGDDPAWAVSDFDDGSWERRHWAAVETRDVWWLRSRVELPAELTDSGVPLGLYLNAIAAAEVYWDGEPIGAKGQVGPDAASEVAGPMVAVVPLPPEATSTGEHLLAIRWSAHLASPRISTPVDAIYFGAYGSPLRFARDLYLPSLVAGGALVLALIFLVVLSVRGPDPVAGWLALAALGALAQLAAETSRAFIAYDYTLHGARLAAIGIGAVITGLGLLGFCLARFLPRRHAWPWLAAGAAVAVSIVLFADLGDLGTFGVLLASLVGSTVLAARGVWRRLRGAGVALGAFLLLGFFLWLDGVLFLDRSFFLGLVALLLLFFVEHVRSHVEARYEREQAQLKAARLELELVKRHIQPHFLLNTLTTLSELVETDPAKANAMIHALGDEFRLLNELSSRDRIELTQEIALCRAHLEVMQLRYAADLELVVVGDPADIDLPPAVLHTLIENALTHNRYDNGTVRFRLSLEKVPKGHALQLSAPLGRTTNREGLAGIGTGYVRARLEEAFGTAARVISRQTAEAWITRMEIPA